MRNTNQIHNNNQHTECNYFVETADFLQCCSEGIFGGTQMKFHPFMNTDKRDRTKEKNFIKGKLYDIFVCSMFEKRDPFVC